MVPKFSRAHAHARHPSAGSCGIGSDFEVGFFPPHLGGGQAGGGASLLQQVCVQMHHYQAGWAPESAPPSPPPQPPAPAEVVASSISQVPLSLWITCPRPCPPPAAYCPEDTSHIIQAGAWAVGRGVQIWSFASQVELRCHSGQMGGGGLQITRPTPKDATLGGVPGLAETARPTGADAPRLTAAINRVLEILEVFVAQTGSAAEPPPTGRTRFRLNVSPTRVRRDCGLENATAGVAAFNLARTLGGICLRCVKYIWEYL